MKEHDRKNLEKKEEEGRLFGLTPPECCESMTSKKGILAGTGSRGSLVVFLRFFFHVCRQDFQEVSPSQI